MFPGSRASRIEKKGASTGIGGNFHLRRGTGKGYCRGRDIQVGRVGFFA